MKVLLLNGSPHKNGCTDAALELVAERLNRAGIDTEIFWIGNRPIGGCIACGACKNTGKCVMDDCLNDVLDKIEEVDGIVFGAPVHYASPAGNMIAFMDRLFYAGGGKLRYKPAAVVTTARRAGTTASLEVLEKYPQFNDMPLISSRYWNMVHGSTPEDVKKDAEGVQIMQELGDNMAWIIKCIAAGSKAGVLQPTPMQKVFTNYIQ